VIKLKWINIEMKGIYSEVPNASRKSDIIFSSLSDKEMFCVFHEIFLDTREKLKHELSPSDFASIPSRFENYIFGIQGSKPCYPFDFTITGYFSDVYHPSRQVTIEVNPVNEIAAIDFIIILYQFLCGLRDKMMADIDQAGLVEMSGRFNIYPYQRQQDEKPFVVINNFISNSKSIQ
jgi:hypothetical protein